MDVTRDPMIMPICTQCRRRFDRLPAGEFRCEAFPDGEGIPDEILFMDHDHRNPWPGDHGIRFEPLDKGASATTVISAVSVSSLERDAFAMPISSRCGEDVRTREVPSHETNRQRHIFRLHLASDGRGNSGVVPDGEAC